MERFITSFLLFLVFLLPAGSQALQESRNFVDRDGLRQGLWEQHYPNGNVRYRGTFRNNKPAGEFIRYFDNGGRMAVMNFCDDGIRADALLFYQDGSTAAHGTYINEKKDSIWQYYSFYDKRLTSSETYREGLKEGLAAVYYPCGRVFETFWYEGDRKNGPWRQYYENGTLKMEAFFENDLRHGEFRSFAPTGRVEIIGRYNNNQMHGNWIRYDGSGSQISAIEYKAGKPVNEDEYIDKQQEMFRLIEDMRGKIPEPDESELFVPRRY
jgi:antitoxin component YwqK of YwqJK toxin-antitoxin module